MIDENGAVTALSAHPILAILRRPDLFDGTEFADRTIEHWQAIGRLATGALLCDDQIKTGRAIWETEVPTCLLVAYTGAIGIAVGAAQQPTQCPQRTAAFAQARALMEFADELHVRNTSLRIDTEHRRLTEEHP